MNEVHEQSEEEAPIYRYLVTVDGSPVSKSQFFQGSVESAQEMNGITNDEIEIHTIH